MTTKKSLQGLIVTVALCLGATAGRAQESLVFVTGGASRLGDARSFSEAYIPYSTDYASGGSANLGVLVPIKKSKIFGIEGSYGFTQNNLELSNLSISPVTVKSYGLRDNRFSADLVVRSPNSYHNARPYGVFGLEYDRYSPTSSATSLATSTGFGYAASAKLSSQGDAGVNFGGGVDYKVSERLSLRLDVRAHITSSPTFGLPSGPTPTSAAYYPVTGNSRDIVYTIGIVYHFGREQSSSAPTKSPRPRSSRQPTTQKMPSYPPSPF